MDAPDFGFQAESRGGWNPVIANTVHFVPQAEARGGGPAGDGGSQEVSGGDGPETGPVSYTHLTLPTNHRV